MLLGSLVKIGLFASLSQMIGAKLFRVRWGSFGEDRSKTLPVELFPPPPTFPHSDRENQQVLNMVLCMYIHMQVSAKMSICVDTLNNNTTCEPLNSIHQ